ncbi:cell division protein ZapD [Candidatus Methylocalor cossyra]
MTCSQAILPGLSNEFTVYEFPLNERIRLFMRLEQLFQQLDHFMEGEAIWDSRAVIATLMDVLALFSRNDLKSEVLKELDRHAAALTKMARAQHPDIDPGKLHRVLGQLDQLSRELYRTPGKIGASLMENDLFKSISQRSSIPGGTCSFDLPAFHYWLQLEDAHRKQCLEEWTRPFQRVRAAIDLLLNAIRNCAEPTEQRANAGFFQRTLDHTIPYQLLRVAIPRSQPYFAEISGGKHRFTVRFMLFDTVQRPVQCPQDVPFLLTCCSL